MVKAQSRFKFIRTFASFRGATVWHVARHGRTIGRVHRTGKGEKWWCNDNEDRTYYRSRQLAAIGLEKSFRRPTSSEPCPHCGHGPKFL